MKQCYALCVLLCPYSLNIVFNYCKIYAVFMMKMWRKIMNYKLHAWSLRLGCHSVNSNYNILLGGGGGGGGSLVVQTLAFSI